MYQSTHTGAQVDEAVDKALSADAVPTPGSTNLVQSGGVFGVVSNRNLLDNWYFVNPVNQRGSTSYTASGYTIDRWEFGLWNTTSPSVQLTSSGLKISGTASGSCSCQLTQKIENPDWLSGKTVTISCQVAERVAGNSLRLSLSTNISGGGTFIALTGTGLFTKTVTLPNGITSASVWIGQNGSSSGSGNTDFTVSAIKLELGSVSTLANDAPPNYAEELAKCQRYCYVIKAPAATNLTLCAANAYDANSVYVGFPVPPQMRTPTLSLSSASAIKIGTSGFTITPSSVSVYGYAAGIVTMLIAAISLTAGTTYRVGLMAGESIIFAADL